LRADGPALAARLGVSRSPSLPGSSPICRRPGINNIEIIKEGKAKAVFRKSLYKYEYVI
jgi:hypothetical protein